MGIVASLLQDVALPRMVPIHQSFDPTHIEPQQIPELVARRLSRPEIAGKFHPGMEVAVTVGSRGIANIALITKSIVDFLKSAGVKPFVIPAMGSHGGATAEGQRAVIEAYGVAEEYIGCEIRSRMETVEIGKTANGRPVRIDKYASQADGIIVCGRVKPHTGFRGPYESGIMKMMAIGLADCTTRRLFERMDLEQTYPNAITNTVVGEMKIPMIMENDKLAVQVAMKSCNEIGRARPRVVHIHTTLEMERIEISEAMLEEAAAHPDIEILGEPRPFPFDENGNLF